jgi:formylglycine-generating enzyme required for sulfatase activity
MLIAIFNGFNRGNRRRSVLWGAVPLLLAAGLLGVVVLNPRRPLVELFGSRDSSPAVSADSTTFSGPTLAAHFREMQLLQETTAEVLVRPVEFVNSFGLKFRLIPSGRFDMGSPPTEEGRAAHEGPQHPVEISSPFYAGVTEVTQGQWRAVMGTEPWQGELPAVDDDSPATFVSWDDAVAFTRRLSELEGRSYRLPSEAEWEWLCRAGTAARFSFGNDLSLLFEHAWFNKNANIGAYKYAQPVAQKKPNPFGLHDLHGNVREWCSDWYSATWYEESPVMNPAGPETGVFRVLRGGAWNSRALRLRCADRVYSSPDFHGHSVGFRVILE